jgi:hypothetical protein
MPRVTDKNVFKFLRPSSLTTNLVALIQVNLRSLYEKVLALERMDIDDNTDDDDGAWEGA